MMDDAAYLAQRIDDFETAQDASDIARQKAERDIDYCHGKQMTEEEKKKLEKRGQPPVSFNMVRQKIEFLIGLINREATVPRALPRTPGHEDDAHSATDALRFVADDNRYRRVRARAARDVVMAGWGGVEITAEPVDNPRDGMPAYRIRQRRCPWDRMFWDPFSSEEDFSDAAYLGLVLWMDRTEAVRRWGEDAGAVFDETVSVSDTYDDKPKNVSWLRTGGRRRVRVVQMYHMDDDTGQWSYCAFTKGGILESMPSPWLDEHGKSTHPYEWRSDYIDRENNRYGEIRDLIDPQDEMNKRRSKSLHHAVTRQTFGTPEAMGGMSIRDMRRELARPDGHVQMPPNARWGENFGVIPTNDQAAANMQLLQQTVQMFEVMGPNASMMGKAEGRQSGRALIAQMQGGEIQQGGLVDTIKDMDYGVYRKTWNNIRQFWTGPTWVRVTDDERNLRWVGLNVPKMQQVQAPDGRVVEMPVIDPATGQPQMQNVVSELDVDLILDDAPDLGTIQQEEFAQLTDLTKNGVLPPSPVMAKAILKASSIRGKADLLKAIDEAQQGQQGPPPELQLKQAEMEMKAKMQQADIAMKAQASQQQLAAEIEAMRVRTAAEIEMKRQSAMADIEIERMKAAAQIEMDRQMGAMKMAQAVMPDAVAVIAGQ